jgi:hypothetical protein
MGDRFPTFKKAHGVSGDKVFSFLSINQYTLRSGGVAWDQDRLDTLLHFTDAVNNFNLIQIIDKLWLA